MLLNRSLSRKRFQLSSIDIPLWMIFAVGIIHGLLYVFLAPPWQHYDEPGHFEYAWLLANREETPAAGDFDPAMRKAVLDSMIRHNFFRGMDIEPSWVVVPQLIDPPLYHLIASVPLRMFKFLTVTDQMYLMRMSSFGWYLVSIFAAWAAVREVTQPANTLRFLVPMFLVLLPGFTDLMTAINNDSAAVALFSIFIWLSLRLTKTGFRIKEAAALFAIVAMAFFTKKTVWIIAAFIPLILLLAVLRPRWRIWAWISIVMLVIASMLFLFTSGDARYWYRVTEQESYTREVSTGYLGLPQALRVEAPASEAMITGLLQLVPEEKSALLAGKTITLGAWMWSDREVAVASPAIQFITHPQNKLDPVYKTVNIGPQPQFIWIETTVPDNIWRMIVKLTPSTQDVVEPVKVYYSGIFLSEGSCTFGEAPSFSNNDGSDGVWCGQPFQNVIRNGNATQAWPVVRDSAIKLLPGGMINRSSFSSLIVYFLDRAGSRWYEQVSVPHLMQTFWARFGWGHVSLLGGFSYPILYGITGICLVGVLIAAVFRRQEWLNRDPSVYLLIALFGVVGWFIGHMAGIYFGGLIDLVTIPVARYAYPVIIPTAMALAFGWMEWFRLLGNRWKGVENSGPIIFIVLFLILDILALASLLQYYA